MTYKETIEYLFNSTPVFEHVGASAYKEGLETTLILDEHFQHPHRNYKTIHIAGTNGKGSVSHSIAAILQKNGLKVGLYTSPHLIDFRERIRVNGECIDKKRVIDFVEQERHFFEPLHPSFFELTTALAFKYFEEQQVDVAVIEVGLGGRLDCTNIITPVLSIITNISFDHTQLLGNSLTEIAMEKAGIIKQGVPVVIGEAATEIRQVFEKKASEVNAPIVYAEEFESETSLPEFELKGSYQVKNLQTILCAVRQLSLLGHKYEIFPSLRKDYVEAALSQVCELTGIMGRWQILRSNPLTICDTGHNVAGWQYLSAQIHDVKAETKRIVFGMVNDKDIDTVLSLLPKNAIYYFTQAQSKRAIPVSAIQEKAEKLQLRGRGYPNVPIAYQAALREATDSDFIFIGGSSYIVADLLSYLNPEK